jgi:hypothetical protein
MRNKMRILGLVTLLFAGFGLEAQAPNGSQHMIDMSGVLGYVIVLYSLTFVSLGLLIMKLVRPNFSIKWLYISCIAGILISGATTFAFKGVQDEQLPEIENSDMRPEEMSKENYELYRQRQKEVQQQQFANFWIIAIPNIVILGLGIFADRSNRRRDPDKPRGRYD